MAQTKSQTSRRHAWGRRGAIVGLVVCSIGSLLCLTPWIYVRIHGPVEWNRREGATAVSWIADKNGILHVVTIEDKGRMAADLHSGPRTTVDSESIWHRRGQTRQQQFTWNTQTKGMVAFWVLTTKQWTRFYTGRIAVTLAIPPAVWLWILAWPRVTARFANRRGICPQCGYDMRATPNRCPECGRLFPPTVNPDELAARLNEVR